MELYSNAKESKAVEVAVRLEQFRTVLASSIPAFSRRPLGSVRVILFKNSKSFEPYRGLMDPRAYYLRNRFESFIVLNATPPSVTRARSSIMLQNPYTFHPYHDIYHEYVHYLTDNSLLNCPTWLAEGLAEYYATFGVKKGQAVIGLPIDVRVNFLKRNLGGWFPPSMLFGITSVGAAHPALTTMFYSESWAVVHYMVHADDERRREFDNYLVNLARGVPWKSAFTHSFSIDEEELIEKTRRYISSDQLPYYKLDSSQVNLGLEPEIAQLSHPEVLCLLGTLLITLSPFEAGEARSYFEAALAIDPSHAEARFGLAIVADAEGRLDDAAAQYRKALALAPDDERIQLRFGFNRLATVERAFAVDRSGATDVAPMLSEARTAFGVSLRRRDDLVLAYLGLGRTYLYDDDAPAAVFASLDRARHLAPEEGTAPLILAMLHFKAGRDTQAEGTVRGVLRTFPFHFLAALQMEMGRAVIPVARGHSLYEPQLRQLCDFMRSLNEEDPTPGLPSAVEWTDLTPWIDSLSLRLRLLDVSRAIAAGERERARGLLEPILGELDDDAGQLLAAALTEILAEE